jgi:phospholipid transport system substrate-binding protein
MAGKASMSKHLARVLGILFLLLAFSPGYSASAGAPSDQLRAGIDRVFQILRANLPLRRVAIITAASDLFDFGEMARRSLGRHWTQRTIAEREEFVRVFTTLVQHTYISRVDQRGTGDIVVKDEVLDGQSALVRTTLRVSAGQLLALDYRMHNVDDRWKVYDLDAGGVSVVGSYRAQFDKIIRTSSYESLVSKLRSRETASAERPIATGRENAP